VSLGSDISLSLQIPPITSTPYLPSLTEPPIQPGLWLTTANEPTDSTDLENANTISSSQLAKSFTLLLREPAHKILKDIQTTGGPLPPQLVDFVTNLRPSKSFHKISQATHLPLADVQLLSRHLIYWRRAVAIPPLHHRDTYIVSPNCDLSSLAAATTVFATTFPMLPPLTRILSILSTGPPIPFGTLIPSSDHKEEYYRVLAWLLRGGWVTQLRTFAYVRVSPTTKAAVREHERSEKVSAAHSGLERLDLNPRHQPSKSSNNAHQATLQLSSSNASSVSEHFHHQTLPSNDAHRPSITSRPSSEATTARSSNAAGSTATSTNHPHPQISPRHASLIYSPLRATPAESAWLSRIHASLLTADIADLDLSSQEKQALHTAWPTLLKYFNGTEALEGIAVREGWKRKQVWGLLGQLGIKWGWDLGIADQDTGERKGVVVTVRHW
jgi:nitrogen permease regulator 3-like protein